MFSSTCAGGHHWWVMHKSAQWWLTWPPVLCPEPCPLQLSCVFSDLIVIKILTPDPKCKLKLPTGHFTPPAVQAVGSKCPFLAVEMVQKNNRWKVIVLSMHSLVTVQAHTRGMSCISRLLNGPYLNKKNEHEVISCGSYRGTRGQSSGARKTLIFQCHTWHYLDVSWFFYCAIIFKRNKTDLKFKTLLPLFFFGCCIPVWQVFKKRRYKAKKTDHIYRVFKKVNRSASSFPIAENYSTFFHTKRDVPVWCSNNYLGMSHHPKVFTLIICSSCYFCLDQIWWRKIIQGSGQ